MRDGGAVVGRAEDVAAVAHEHQHERRADLRLERGLEGRLRAVVRELELARGGPGRARREAQPEGRGAARLQHHRRQGVEGEARAGEPVRRVAQ
ncbi:MAG: hypothetical protein ACK559_12795, partial [bacterium]